MVSLDALIIDYIANEAWGYQFLAYPNPTVAACILKDSEIVSTAIHTKAGTPHAEVLALKEAYIKLSGDDGIKNLTNSTAIHTYLKQNAKGLFYDCDIYITLEPCNHFGKTPPCSLLLKELKPKRVVYAVDDPNKNSCGGAEELRKSGIEVKKLYSKKADNLLEPFRIWQKRNFTLYKAALRLNGTIDGEVSSLESRTYVHRIRSVVDMLYIGGNTVRIDRPTLDSRLCEGRAPNVTILSHQKEFDRTIPLFGVKDREVNLDQKIERDRASFAMIEGGGVLLEAFKESIEWLLLFVAPRFGGVQKMGTRLNMEVLHCLEMGGDMVLFCRNLSCTHT